MSSFSVFVFCQVVVNLAALAWLRGVSYRATVHEKCMLELASEVNKLREALLHNAAADVAPREERSR